MHPRLLLFAFRNRNRPCRVVEPSFSASKSDQARQEPGTMSLDTLYTGAAASPSQGPKSRLRAFLVSS